MTTIKQLSGSARARHDQRSGSTLRLLWPQWQGADPGVVAALTRELPFDDAQKGYELGARILDLIAPSTDGPRATVPVAMSTENLDINDGIYARDVLQTQLTAALRIIGEHKPERIVTLGGECSVSVAPFSYLASQYGSDLAVVWMDAHPDTGLPQTANNGYHAMALSHLLGHGDPAVVAALPGKLDGSRVALAGLHSWDPDQEPFFTEWGLTRFGPDVLNTDPEPLVTWLRDTGSSRVAIHFDVDSIDSSEIVLGLGQEAGGLTSASAIATLAAVAETVDVVAITIAEYLPRQVIAMRSLLSALPLVGDREQ